MPVSLDFPAPCSLLHAPPHWSGPIAQWLEQRTHNPLVLGSSPSGPTTLNLSPIPAQGFGEPAVAGAETGDVAETGPREMKSVDASPGRGGFGKNFFPGDHGGGRMMIEANDPAGIVKHQDGMMHEVTDV